MAGLTVVVYLLGGERQKVLLEDVSPAILVGDLKLKITSGLGDGFVKGDLGVMAGGIELRDDQSLESCNVVLGGTLVAVESEPEEDAASKSTDGTAAPVDARKVTEALQYFNERSPILSLVDRVVTDPSTMDWLVESVPGLRHDVVAQAALREPEVLDVLARPQQADRMFARHSCLKAALVMLATRVRERALAEGLLLPPSAASASGGAAQAAASAAAAVARPLPPPVSAPVITTSQLSAALAAATAAATTAQSSTALATLQQSSSAGSSPQSAAAAAAVRPISQDYFAQALQRVQRGGIGSGIAGSGARRAVRGSSRSGGASGGAHGTSSSSSGGSRSGATGGPVGASSGGSSSRAGSRQSTNDFESQLRQLRDMGIGNEDLARWALSAANGNVALALELIYGEGAQQE